MTADAPSTRDSFRRRLQPISTPGPVSTLPDRVWTEEDWERIRRGYRARDMDQKWNAFVEGDVLFLHRSWTGRGIYEVSFAPVAGGGRRIVSAVVETDPERYRRTDDAYDCLMMELIISAIILGEPATELWSGFRELHTATPGGNDLPAAAAKHSALGPRSDS
ncbi:hypothetical protein ACPXCP_03500 [Streptomyces sp. DT20]|uniref:hypothetical protein n=1 Tax=Streptomyces sp. DT20 TaxID=3416519 RepID=UPI003CFB0F4D